MRILRRILRITLITLAVLLVLGVGLWLLRGPILSDPLARRIENLVEAEAGVRLEIGEIGGSWIGGVEVVDVRVVSSSGFPALTEGSVGRITASWSLPALILGDDGWIREVRVAEVRAALDLDRIEPAEEAAPSVPGDPSEPVSLYRHLPRAVEVTDVSVSVRSGTRSAVATIPRLGGAAPGAGNTVLFARQGSLRVRGPRGTETLHGLTIDARVGTSAEVHGELAYGSGAVAIDIRGPTDAAGPFAGRLVLRDLRPGPVATGLLAEMDVSLEHVEGSIAFRDLLLEPIQGTVEAALDLDGLVVEGRRADDIGLRAEGPLHDCRVRIEARGPAGVASARGQAGTDGVADLEFRAEAPDLSVLGLLYRGEILAGTLAARGRFRRDEDGIGLEATLEGRELSLGPDEVGEIDLVARGDGSRFAVETLSVRRGFDTADLEGRVDIGDEVHVDLRGGLLVEDVEGIGALLGLDIRGRARGDLRLVGPIEDPTGHVRLESRGLGFEDVRTERVDLEAHVEPGRIRIEKLDVVHDEGSVSLALTAERDAWRSFAGTIDRLAVRRGDAAAELRRPTRFEAVLGERVRVDDLDLEGRHGRAGVSGVVDWAGAFELDLEIEVPDAGAIARRASLDLPVRGSIEGRIRARGTPEAPTVVAEIMLNAPGVTLDDGVKVDLARVVASLEAGLDRAELRRLEIAGPAGTVTLSGRCLLPAPITDLEEIDLDSVRIRARLRAEQIDLSRIEPRPDDLDVSGRLTLAVEANGTLAEPGLTGDVTASGVLLRATGLPDIDLSALRLNGTTDRVEVVELRTDVAGVSLSASGRADLVDGEPTNVALKVDATAEDLRRVLDRLGTGAPADVAPGRAEAHISIEGPADDLGATLRVSAEGIRWRDVPPSRLEIDASVKDGVARVDSLQLHSDRGRIDGEGRWAMRIGAWPPSLRTGPLSDIEGEIVCEELVLDRLQDVLPPGLGLRNVEGRVSFRALRRRGDPLLQPDGELHIRRLGVRLSRQRESLRHLDADVTFADGKLDLTRLHGRFGHAPVTVTGFLDLDPDDSGGESAEGWSWKASLEADRLLLASDLTLRCRADLRLEASGNARDTQVTGNVYLRNLLYTENVRLVDFESRPTLAALPLAVPEPFGSIRLRNIHIQGNRDLRIDNNVVRAEIATDLRLGGTLAYPSLDGRVQVNRGRLSLPGFSLRIAVGEVDFRPTHELKPEIAFIGMTQRRRIELEVSAIGPLDRLEIDFASNPDLSREDILTLLTTGVLRSELTAGTAGEAAAWAGAGILWDELRGSSTVKDPEDMSTLERLQHELTERTDVSTDSVPGGREPIVSALVRVLDWLEMQGEKDEYGEYNIDFVFRLIGR